MVAAAGATAAAAGAVAASSKPATVPATSPWARPSSDSLRPTAGAGGSAKETADREGLVAPGPYRPNVQAASSSSAPATSASSAPEAKPLYRSDPPAGAAVAAAAATQAPQSRFPQPATPEGEPGAAPEPALEETAGPSTAVLPAVPAAVPAAVVASKAPESLAAAKPRAGTPRRTRKARLRLSRLDPWSVMKTSFLFSIAAGIMLVVAVYVIWTVLSTSGLFDSVNEIVASVVSTPGDTTPFRIEEYINTQKVMGVSALIACVDVVIFTALATLGSFLYNLAATMLGGLEITLAED
ncbi:MAG TPA: DUF3566 domain-containing protein [Microlunatus sp.]